jgi:hypothetical protein
LRFESEKINKEGRSGEGGKKRREVLDYSSIPTHGISLQLIETFLVFNFI